MELAGGEAFLGGAVAGGAEGVEEAGGKGDFTGEEAARGFLATAVKIGHGKVLLELIYCHTYFLLRFYNLFTLTFERRCENRINLKSGVWHCPLSILIMDPIYTDTILLEKLGERVFYGGKEADLRKIGNKKSEAPPC